MRQHMEMSFGTKVLWWQAAWVLCLCLLASSAQARRYWHPPKQTRQQAANQSPQQSRAQASLARRTQQCESAWLPLATYQALRNRRKEPRQRFARIGEAAYNGRYVQGGLTFSATLTVETQGAGWHKIPVLPARYPLKKASIDGKPAWLLPASTRDGFVYLVLQGTQRKHLHLEFFVARAKGPDPQVALQMATASASHLRVVFPGRSFRPSLKGGLGTKLTHTKQETILQTWLAPGQRTHTLAWWQATQTQKTQAQKTKKQARTYAKTFSLLSVGRGGQELFFTVRYTIVHAPREQFQLRIPAGLQLRQVRGLGIRDYRLSKAKTGKDQILDVLLIEPVTERYELSILAELKRQKSIKLRLPQPLGVQRETGYLGVEVIGNDEIEVKAKGAVTVDVQELPTEITRDTARPVLRAYRYIRRPFSWQVEVRQHKNVSVPASVIDQAIYLLVANTRGKTWVQATYQVRNTFKQFVALTLPKGAQMQSAFVSGRPVKPAKDPRGRILIPLKRSGKTSGNSFRVELIYSLQSSRFGHQSIMRARSVHRYLLPAVDLWISTLHWQLYLPQGKVLWRTKKLGRERPRGYSSWAQNTSDISAHSWSGRTRVTIKTTPQGGTINLPTSGKTVGVLPVRIKLPRTGHFYQFNRYHLAPHEPTQLDFSYQPPWLGTLGIGLLLISGLFLGFALTLGTLGKHWRNPLVWSSIAAAGISVLLGTQMNQSFTLNVVVGGAFCGLLLATALHILRSLDKKPAPLT